MFLTTVGNISSLYKTSLDRLLYIKNNVAITNQLTATAHTDTRALLDNFLLLREQFLFLNMNSLEGSYVLYYLNDFEIENTFIAPFDKLDAATREKLNKLGEYDLISNIAKFDDRIYYLCIYSPIFRYNERIGFIEWKISLNDIMNLFSRMGDEDFCVFYKTSANTVLKLEKNLLSVVDDIAVPQGHFIMSSNVTATSDELSIVVKDYKISKIMLLMLFMYSLLLLVGIPLVLFVANKTAYKLTSGLYSILDYIDKNPNGKFTSEEIETNHISDYEEFKTIYKKMRETFVKIEKYHREISSQRLKEQQIKLELLQADLNPHFLYNCLSAMRWLTDDKNINNALMSLISFYRKFLNNGNLLTTIRNEIQMVEDYLDIQKIVSQKEIVFQKAIAEGAYDHYIIKNIFQPIVENAVLHGISENIGDSILKMSCEFIEDKLAIEISDNGTGMPQEKLDEIMVGENRAKSGGYGFKNIIQRLKVYYTDNFTLNIESKEEVGTKVVITISLSSLGKNDAGHY